MPILTKENSGLVVKIGRAGRMGLYVNGVSVPGLTAITHTDSCLGDPNEPRAMVTFSIPARFITFENIEGGPDG